MLGLYAPRRTLFSRLYTFKKPVWVLRCRGPAKEEGWLYPVAHYAGRNFLLTPYLELHSLNASAIKTYLREVAEAQPSRLASRADLIAQTTHSIPRPSRRTNC
jgi:hypothetical protein